MRRWREGGKERGREGERERGREGEQRRKGEQRQKGNQKRNCEIPHKISSMFVVYICLKALPSIGHLHSAIDSRVLATHLRSIQSTSSSGVYV